MRAHWITIIGKIIEDNKSKEEVTASWLIYEVKADTAILKLEVVCVWDKIEWINTWDKLIIKNNKYVTFEWLTIIYLDHVLAIL